MLREPTKVVIGYGDARMTAAIAGALLTIELQRMLSICLGHEGAVRTVSKREGASQRQPFPNLLAHGLHSRAAATHGENEVPILQSYRLGVVQSRFGGNDRRLDVMGHHRRGDIEVPRTIVRVVGVEGFRLQRRVPF